MPWEDETARTLRHAASLLALDEASARLALPVVAPSDPAVSLELLLASLLAPMRAGDDLPTRPTLVAAAPLAAVWPAAPVVRADAPATATATAPPRVAAPRSPVTRSGAWPPAARTQPAPALHSWPEPRDGDPHAPHATSRAPDPPRVMSRMLRPRPSVEPPPARRGPSAEQGSLLARDARAPRDAALGAPVAAPGVSPALDTSALAMPLRPATRQLDALLQAHVAQAEPLGRDSLELHGDAVLRPERMPAFVESERSAAQRDWPAEPQPRAPSPEAPVAPTAMDGRSVHLPPLGAVAHAYPTAPVAAMALVTEVAAFDDPPRERASAAMAEEQLVDRLLDRLQDRLRDEALRRLGITGGVL
jgi:hypothetical protein